MADLLDLQFELNSLQQGIHQMDKITPDNSDGTLDMDPFGDSFVNIKVSILFDYETFFVRIFCEVELRKNIQ